jgi:hypothetical protein
MDVMLESGAGLAVCRARHFLTQGDGFSRRSVPGLIVTSGVTPARPAREDQTTGDPYISPRGSLMSSRRAASGSRK